MENNYKEYFITEDGHIYKDDIELDYTIGTSDTKKGHKLVSIRFKPQVYREKKVAALVGEVYLDKPSKCKAIIFIDGDITHIHKDNLKWVTTTESGQLGKEKKPKPKIIDTETKRLAASMAW